MVPPCAGVSAAIVAGLILRDRNWRCRKGWRLKMCMRRSARGVAVGTENVGGVLRRRLLGRGWAFCTPLATLYGLFMGDEWGIGNNNEITAHAGCGEVKMQSIIYALAVYILVDFCASPCLTSQKLRPKRPSSGLLTPSSRHGRYCYPKISPGPARRCPAERCSIYLLSLLYTPNEVTSLIFGTTLH